LAFGAGARGETGAREQHAEPSPSARAGQSHARRSHLRAAVRLALMGLPIAVLMPLALVSRALAAMPARTTRVAGLRLGLWVQRHWARGTLWGAGVRLDAPRSPARGTRIVLANHVSYMDILVLSSTCSARMVAKSEIARWPLLGHLARSVGTIFLERRERRAVLPVSEEIARTLSAGVPVGIFPEGHASSGASVAPFRGALLETAVGAQVPILAVGLSYDTPSDVQPPAQLVCWHDSTPFWKHFWRLLTVRDIVARVRWSGPHDAGADRKELALRMHAEVSALAQPIRALPLAPAASAPAR
jgi:1-acyl-sn-glycerol-3-phosphate acyltransferase